MKYSNSMSSGCRKLPAFHSPARCWLFQLGMLAFLGVATASPADIMVTLVNSTGTLETRPFTLLEGGAGNADANRLTLNDAFAWMRVQKEADVANGRVQKRVHFVFPKGTFYLNGSISPSGQKRGRGEVGASYCLFEFPAGINNFTEFVFTGTPVVGSDLSPQKYNLITMVAKVVDQDPPHDLRAPRPGEENWEHLSYFGFGPSFAPTKGTYLVGGDLHQDDGRCYNRWVAFDIRNCSTLQMTGNLRLKRDLGGAAVSADRIVALASSGGARDASYDPTPNHPGDEEKFQDTFEYSGLQRGSIESLRITNFNIGMFAEQYNASVVLGTDTFTSVAISNLRMEGCHHCFIGAQNQFDSLSIGTFYGEASETSYLYGVRAIHFGTAEFRSTAPTVGSGRRPKFLEVDHAEVHFGALKTFVTSSNACYSLLNAANNASIVIKSIEQLGGNVTTSGCLVTAAKTDAAAPGMVPENRSTETNLTILQTTGNGTLSVSLIGLAHQVPLTTGVPIQRKIRLGDLQVAGVAEFGGPLNTTWGIAPPNAVVKVLPGDFGDPAPDVTNTTDKIWINTKNPSTGNTLTNYYYIREDDTLQQWLP